MSLWLLINFSKQIVFIFFDYLVIASWMMKPSAFTLVLYCILKINTCIVFNMIMVQFLYLPYIWPSLIFPKCRIWNHFWDDTHNCKKLPLRLTILFFREMEEMQPLGSLIFLPLSYSRGGKVRNSEDEVGRNDLNLFSWDFPFWHFIWVQLEGVNTSLKSIFLPWCYTENWLNRMIRWKKMIRDENKMIRDERYMGEQSK